MRGVRMSDRVLLAWMVKSWGSMPRPKPRPVSEISRRQNRILAALSEPEARRLSSHLQEVSFPEKHVLQRAGDRVRLVYFPTGGVFSITAVLPDGALVESATIGDEGIVGIEPFLTEDATALGEVILQVPEGTAWKLDVSVFRQEVEQRGTLARLVARYTQVLLAQTMQACACSAHHQVQDRCAKWLLLTHDRMHTDEFRLSHEVLAMMLGATRPTVTMVARALQAAGLITYTYGRVTVRDREGLERAACSCYATLRTQFETIR